MPMETGTLGAHEALEVHELLNFKTLCAAKSKLLQGLIFDQELKDLMEKDVQQALRDIANLQSLYQKASFQTEIPEFRPTPILDKG